MINNYINPADPVTSPNAQQLVDSFLSKIAEAKGGQPTQATPAPTQAANETPEEQSQQEATKVDDMQRYLAPIKMNKFNADQGYTDDHHATFTDNLFNDPVFEKIEPLIDAFNNGMKAGLADGSISPERAQIENENFKRNVIYPIVHEMHGPHSETHNTSLLAKKKAEIPEFVKQVTGAK
ncbi:hypothetical protein DLL80_23865 [Salmonella enterica subsp. enterica serovar Newport]|uniref:Uncharacterized protein n=1 Tax=Salmonella newport TaxID=108619 RepID=A0A5V6RMK9_SALNE|nr:hypothetical protein [Salmonella enterica subsp. enterica serovar Newport]